jgi:hypothetical protein
MLTLSTCMHCEFSLPTTHPHSSAAAYTHWNSILGTVLAAAVMLFHVVIVAVNYPPTFTGGRHVVLVPC